MTATPETAPTRDAKLIAREIMAEIPGHWRMARGGRFPDAHVRARLVAAEGLSDRTTLTVVLGGISADRFVAWEGPHAKGWWADVVRPGGGVDPTRTRVLSVDFAPLGPEQAVEITPDDQARLLALALDAAGVDQPVRLVGASYGGMIALAFAARFPERAEHLTAICCAHRPHPMATAWRSVQRGVIRMGLEAGKADEAMALARGLAMTTYRSPDEFKERFCPGEAPGDSRPDVRGYLAARGRAFAQAFTPARALSLSQSIDLHQVDPAKVTCPVDLIAFDTDQLIPLVDMEELRSALPNAKGLTVIESLYGHDAFLKEIGPVNRALRAGPVDAEGAIPFRGTIADAA